MADTERRPSRLEQAAALEATARAVLSAHPERIASKLDPVDISTEVPPDFMAAVDRLHPLRVGGPIPTPKVLRNVRPVYSASAQAFRIQGVVIVEVVIGQEGDARAARVVCSIPLLDEGALEAGDFFCHLHDCGAATFRQLRPGVRIASELFQRRDRRTGVRGVRMLG